MMASDFSSSHVEMLSWLKWGSFRDKIEVRNVVRDRIQARLEVNLSLILRANMKSDKDFKLCLQEGQAELAHVLELELGELAKNP